MIAVLTLAACADDPPLPGAGTMTVTVTSPNSAEGAALVTVTGPGITGVTSNGLQVYGEVVGQTATVVVIAEPAGELSFGVTVEDTTATFTGAVLEVASPFDLPRATLADYSVEVRR